MHIRRWSAVCLGFVGAFIVLRPGFQQVTTGMLLVVGASVAGGMATVVVKRLSRTDSVVSIVAWMAIFLTVFSFVPALLVRTWPSWQQLFWLGLLGALGSAGHLSMTNALKLANTTTLMPLDFTRLLWASIIGYFASHEIPDAWTWIGGGIIIASASYLIFREAQVAPRSTKEKLVQ
jgi:drug/metabolite transporter (DMT)-like permease